MSREYFVVYDAAAGEEVSRGSGPEGAAAQQPLEPPLRALVIPKAAYAGKPQELAAAIAQALAAPPHD